MSHCEVGAAEVAETEDIEPCPTGLALGLLVRDVADDLCPPVFEARLAFVRVEFAIGFGTAADMEGAEDALTDADTIG